MRQEGWVWVLSRPKQNSQGLRTKEEDATTTYSSNKLALPQQVRGLHVAAHQQQHTPQLATIMRWG
jgi:hypothetical protein